MKNLVAAGVVACMIVLGACTAEVVATRPADVVYVRPEAPGPDYIWISGDWVWSGGVYRWHEGHWDRRTEGREWHEGGWEQSGKGWKWRKGHWK